jgi:group I intron endonuclease
MLYIGMTTKSIEHRWKMHLNWAKSMKPYKIHEALNTFGKDSFIIEQIDSAEDFKKLKELEKKHIKSYNCIYPNGYNLTAGGQGVLGFKFSEERKQKLSAAGKIRGNANMITKEAIEKSRISRIGQKRTVLQKMTISTNRIGKGLLNDGARKHSKEKVLLAMNLIKNNMKQIDISKLTGLTQSYVSNLKTGKRGRALIGV